MTAMRDINTAIAAMRKSDLVATLVCSNPGFSEKKLMRKTRDEITDFYGVELRRLVALKLDSELETAE